MVALDYYSNSIKPILSKVHGSAFAPHEGYRVQDKVGHTRQFANSAIARALHILHPSKAERKKVGPVHSGGRRNSQRLIRAERDDTRISTEFRSLLRFDG